MLLPAMAGEKRRLVLVGGKNGSLYVLDCERIGKYQPTNNSHAVQVIRFRNGVYGAPAYWNGHVYLLAAEDCVSAFAVGKGRISDRPDTMELKDSATRGAPRGAPPAISANGNRDGILWLIETKTWNGPNRPAILRAYDASNVAKELYHSEQNI
jgi:hypothetical protein